MTWYYLSGSFLPSFTNTGPQTTAKGPHAAHQIFILSTRCFCSCLSCLEIDSFWTHSVYMWNVLSHFSNLLLLSLDSSSQSQAEIFFFYTIPLILMERDHRKIYLENNGSTLIIRKFKSKCSLSGRMVSIKIQENCKARVTGNAMVLYLLGSVPGVIPD